MVAQWQQSQPWQLGAMNQTAQWQPAGSAVAPSLWQQATAQQAAPQSWAPPGGQGQSMGGQPLMSNLSTPKTPAQDMSKSPQLVNPQTGGAGGTPKADGWTNTAQAQTTTPTLAKEQFEDQMNRVGDRGGAVWDQNTGWHGGGSVAAGTAIGTTGAKTWVNYDGSKDTYLHQNGQSTEPSWMRVNRWTTDGVYEHGLTPQEAHNAALARLKRDMGANWAQSGYDLSNVQAALPGQDWGTASAVNGTPQVDPVTGKPKTDPAAVVAPETTPATTPQGGTLKNFGKLQTNDMAALLQAAANDPDRAAQILRMAQGQTGRPLGRMADFRDSLYGRAFQTALSLAGTDGQGDLQGMAGDFLSKGVQGNDLIGHTGNLARTAMGQDFAGIDSATMEKIARAALAMQGLNMGSLGGAVQQGRLDDLVYSDWERNLTDSGNDQRNWADLLKGSRFQQSMQNYGRR